MFWCKLVDFVMYHYSSSFWISSILFNISQEFGSTEFLGYETEESEAKVLAIVCEGTEVSNAIAGASVQIVFNQTPFYAESGGQVGDQGKFSCSSGSGQILDCIKQGKIFLHTIKIDEGAIKLSDKLKLAVEPDKRASAASNHSATHLMHAALKHVLGSHVEQKGSLVDASKLRFDFSHPKAVTKDEIKQIELLVNQHTLNNAEVKTELKEKKKRTRVSKKTEE